MRSHIDALWEEDIGNLGAEAFQALNERDKMFYTREADAWDRIIFVPHSLGAVVVRRALLDCYLDETDQHGSEHWSRNSSLCLFAPAHSGANILRLIGETFSTLGVPMGRSSSRFTRVYKILRMAARP